MERSTILKCVLLVFLIAFAAQLWSSVSAVPASQQSINDWVEAADAQAGSGARTVAARTSNDSVQ